MIPHPRHTELKTSDADLLAMATDQLGEYLRTLPTMEAKAIAEAVQSTQHRITVLTEAADDPYLAERLKLEKKRLAALLAKQKSPGRRKGTKD